MEISASMLVATSAMAPVCVCVCVCVFVYVCVTVSEERGGERAGLRTQWHNGVSMVSSSDSCVCA